jgi:peptide-methionine (S)-S-oxide reductase
MRRASYGVDTGATDLEVTVLFGSRTKSQMPAPDEALRGRDERPYDVPPTHAVLGTPIEGDAPEGFEVAVFGLGCFWGAEEAFWRLPGVWSTSVGYSGGLTPNPTYEEVCTGRTGHTEAVRVVFDPAKISYADLVRTFFEIHDPTQGMRQGNDLGTQYRSAIYTFSPEQAETARRLKEAYEPVLVGRGYGPITTEIAPAGPYYYAEDYHQQYLYKVPGGYRCHAATGVPMPWPVEGVETMRRG